MTWEFLMVTPEQMEREVERHFARGARYVLVRSGPAFMAIRWDNNFIDDIRFAEEFLYDVDAKLRVTAVEELMLKAALQPNHVAILLAIR